MAVERQKGFSLIELLVVVAILMCVAAVATPNMIGIIATSRIRSSMGNLSGFIQNCRSTAVRFNTTKSVFNTQIQGGPFAYIADPTATSISSAEAQLPIGRSALWISDLSTAGAEAPAELTSELAFQNSTLVADHSTVSFNNRGLPCKYVSGTGACNTGTGFIWYFRFQPPFGQNRWAALSISPAGRIKSWYWSGTAWSN